MYLHQLCPWSYTGYVIRHLFKMYKSEQEMQWLKYSAYMNANSINIILCTSCHCYLSIYHWAEWIILILLILWLLLLSVMWFSVSNFFNCRWALKYWQFVITCLASANFLLPFLICFSPSDDLPALGSWKRPYEHGEIPCWQRSRYQHHRWSWGRCIWLYQWKFRWFDLCYLLYVHVCINRGRNKFMLNEFRIQMGFMLTQSWILVSAWVVEIGL